MLRYAYAIIGVTKGPNVNDGPIGRILNSATDLEICKNKYKCQSILISELFLR